ncbi:MAG: sulfur oxidation c-type cytochrome SoxX [Proteobacteria bacterium]|nr:MAG: sulfur oxidation c-type cytochrome SoxX [Pseudomonadota bacterium]
MTCLSTHLARTLFALLLFSASAVNAQSSDEEIWRQTERALRESFASATPEEWAARLDQDEMQALCTQWRNAPPADVAAKITREAQQSIRYPQNNQLLGDWKAGERLASSGTGGHIGMIQPDPPDRKRGGNCYACHQLAATELAAGNLGPSLTGYSKLHGRSPERVKYVYDKIYNAQAYSACSMMPRFGHSGWLTPEEIADAVAFLLDSDSPVNK